MRKRATLLPRRAAATGTVTAVLTAVLLSGCAVSGDASGQDAGKAGGEESGQLVESSSGTGEDFDGLSFGWPEAGSQNAPSQHRPSPELLTEEERVIIWEVDLDLEIAPKDTVDMVEKLKALAAEHGGYLSALSCSQYDILEEEEEAGDSSDEREESSGEEEPEKISAALDAEAGEDGSQDIEGDCYDDYYDYYDYDYYDYYYDGYSRWAEASFLIPEEQADTFIKKLTQDGNVIDRTDEMEDYTTVYQNLVGRIKALEEEERRLITMLEEARRSGKGRLADEESGFLEKMMRLENNLWSTRSELDHYRYGSGEDDYYSSYYSHYFAGASLSEFDERKGRTLIEVDIYVAE